MQDGTEAFAPDGAAEAMARGQLIGRLWRAAERRALAVERRIGSNAGDDDLDGVERDAKVLASLARTMRELLVLEQTAAEGRRARANPEAEDEDDLPRDIDAFRDALAERLERLRAER
jgi:hypothetical protein